MAKGGIAGRTRLMFVWTYVARCKSVGWIEMCNVPDIENAMRSGTGNHWPRTKLPRHVLCPLVSRMVRVEHRCWQHLSASCSTLPRNGAPRLLVTQTWSQLHWVGRQSAWTEMADDDEDKDVFFCVSDVVGDRVVGKSQCWEVARSLGLRPGFLRGWPQTAWRELEGSDPLPSLPPSPRTRWGRPSQRQMCLRSKSWECSRERLLASAASGSSSPDATPRRTRLRSAVTTWMSSGSASSWGAGYPITGARAAEVTARTGATYSYAGAGAVSVAARPDAAWPITGAGAADETAGAGATFSFTGAGAVQVTAGST